MGERELDSDAYRQAGGRATPEQMARKHVYVLNGAPEFLDVVREFLQEEAYNVTTTNFVPRTFEMVQAVRPALLVIDLVMGEKAGWDLLVQLREATSKRDIPVVLVSTSSQKLTKARSTYKEFGKDQFLLKPFDLDDLLILIDKMIGTA